MQNIFLTLIFLCASNANASNFLKDLGALPSGEDQAVADGASKGIDFSDLKGLIGQATKKLKGDSSKSEDSTNDSNTNLVEILKDIERLIKDIERLINERLDRIEAMLNGKRPKPLDPELIAEHKRQQMELQKEEEFRLSDDRYNRQPRYSDSNNEDEEYNNYNPRRTQGDNRSKNNYNPRYSNNGNPNRAPQKPSTYNSSTYNNYNTQPNQRYAPYPNYPQNTATYPQNAAPRYGYN